MPRNAVPAVDLPSLQEWYREALRRRVAELESLRPGLINVEADAVSRARRVGHALRGSGGSFGFPEVSEAGRLLDEAAPDAVLRRTEAALHLLRGLAWPHDPRPHAWLAACLGIGGGAAEATLEDAWAGAAATLEVDAHEVARRVAGTLGLDAATALDPAPRALRLVPARILVEHTLLPLDEDGVVLTVAAANPLDVVAEAELQRISGRAIRWVVAPPAHLVRAIRGVAGAAEPASVGAPRAAPTAPERAPVLLVDDDHGARLLARAVLERRGHPVLEAPDGVRALELLAAREDVALAVVDLEMPEMDGRALVRAIRRTRTGAGMAVIVLTGTVDPSVEADLMDQGADDYLRKPLDPRLFLARVSATLRRSGWTPR